MFENPFSLPDRPDPHEALNPLNGDAAQVLKLYVDVDNTEAAFVQFKQALPGPPELTRRGQLVVATGKDGCGKSALINRCAWHVREIVKGAGIQPIVIDARGQAKVSEEMPVRIRQVSIYLREYLESKDLVALGESQLERLREQPREIYSMLDLRLKGDTVVVVLLPRTERIEEIVEYAQYCYARVIFLAELRGLYEREYVRRQAEVPDLRVPIVLDVGLLGDGHGWEFVEKRYEHTGHPEDGPRLAKETVDEMISSRRLPIREFQLVLYLLYEELRKEPKPPREITFEDVARFYYRMGTELRQRNDG